MKQIDNLYGKNWVEHKEYICPHDRYVHCEKCLTAYQEKNKYDNEKREML